MFSQSFGQASPLLLRKSSCFCNHIVGTLPTELRGKCHHNRLGSNQTTCAVQVRLHLHCSNIEAFHELLCSLEG